MTPEQAEADVNRVAEELAKAYPREFEAQAHGCGAHRAVRPSAGAVHGFVAALMALAGMILLAACANLGGLFAAHASDRAKEVALRLALGSTRRRILRQLMTEAMLLALGGGALGVMGGMPLLQRLSTWPRLPELPIHVPVTMDARIYAVALCPRAGQRILVRSRAGAAGHAGAPLRGGEGGNGCQSGSQVYAARRAAGGADRNLRPPGDSFVGCGARAGAELYASYGFDPRNVMAAGVNLANGDTAAIRFSNATAG